MKIIDNVLNGCKFKDLGVGATFKFADKYFIKIEEICDATLGHHNNAVDLKSGDFWWLNDTETVHAFNCELIIL